MYLKVQVNHFLEVAEDLTAKKKPLSKRYRKIGILRQITPIRCLLLAHYRTRQNIPHYSSALLLITILTRWRDNLTCLLESISAKHTL